MADGGRTAYRTGVTALATLAILDTEIRTSTAPTARPCRAPSASSRPSRISPAGSARPERRPAAACRRDDGVRRGVRDDGRRLAARAARQRSELPRRLPLPRGLGRLDERFPDAVTTAWSAAALRLAEAAGIESARAPLAAATAYLDGLTGTDGKTGLREVKRLSERLGHSDGRRPVRPPLDRTRRRRGRAAPRPSPRRCPPTTTSRSSSARSPRYGLPRLNAANKAPRTPSSPPERRRIVPGRQVDRVRRVGVCHRDGDTLRSRLTTAIRSSRPSRQMSGVAELLQGQLQANGNFNWQLQSPDRVGDLKLAIRLPFEVGQIRLEPCDGVLFGHFSSESWQYADSRASLFLRSSSPLRHPGVRGRREHRVGMVRARIGAWSAEPGRRRRSSARI